MSSPKHEQEIVLVTGCVSGVGLATAVLLARDPSQKYLVIATVLSMSMKADLVAALGRHLEKTAFIMEMDITNDEQIVGVVNTVVDRYGRIDILLNIAGVGTCGYLDTMPRRKIEQAFSINVIGVIRLTQAVLPFMKRQKAGRIVAITSRGGRTGLPLLEVYCASKFAIEGFLESLAPVAKQYNIRISMLEPGGIRTTLQKGIFDDMEKVVNDESANDLDRSFARKWIDDVRNSPSTLTPDQAALKLLEIMETKTPKLRYTLPERMWDEIATILADQSGEVGISLNEKRIL